MNTKDFLEFIELKAEDVEEARMEVGDLRAIFNDFEKQQSDFLDAGDYIQRSLGRLPNVHSTRVRVKSPISLARKVVRKCKENPTRNIRLENYKDEIRDLIGLRALHLFKDEWKIVHDGILKKWDLHPEEKQPLAYIRRGDDPTLQQSFEEANCEVVEKGAGYRSVHYVLQIHLQRELYTAEVQVRTLFEEAWGEIDHQVCYPDHQNDPILKDYLLILNRLAGGADEMASLLLRIKTEFSTARSAIAEAKAQKSHAENELSLAKSELNKTISDLQISQEERAQLQDQISQVTDIYQNPSQSGEKIMAEALSTQLRASTFLELHNGRDLIATNARIVAMFDELRRN